MDPLPSRALAHGIPPSSSLKRAKSALLRSKVLILLIALLPPRRILNSTISWSLQLSLPPTFTSSTSPSLFVNTRSSRAPFFVGSSTTCIRKLSSMLCRSVLDCACIAVWSSQLMSGWLKSPMRTRACDCEAACSCL